MSRGLPPFGVPDAGSGDSGPERGHLHGFGGAGATFDDIRLFAEHVGSGVKIKAAGGISTLEDAEKFLELGADRLGTSRIVKLAKQAGAE